MFAKPHKDSRLRGVLWNDIPTGISTIEYIFEYDCEFVGAAITASVTKIGTTMSMETQYNAGPYGWKRYKKFGKDWNLYPNYVCKTILFPTKPSAGVKLLITIDNQEGSPISLGMNLFTFTDLEDVHPSQLGEGSDW